MGMSSERVTAHRETGDMMVTAINSDANTQIDNVALQRQEVGFLYDSDVKSGFGHDLNELVQSNMAKANETFQTQLGQAQGVRGAFETVLDAPRAAAQMLRGIGGH